ncbi:Pseudouridine synthase, Rsu (chromatophore) [Paulinella micropora]|uniref:Pseudouridine synthase n=1 Tax=Paulinella micropora TaxID=1928728 RepID=A0A1L5YCV8_9EUKA|nr:pseudouridine synthase [Paulinella micropora]AQX45302.1 pseudouridine synthase [Paulinella micropora]BBL86520.1 Pseudouridine synthase, Rsu [Paulinella micropora]
MNLQRLQKVIATSGLCSRRQAEDLIREGRVKVNGHIASLGDCVQSSDHIEVNEKTIRSPMSSITLLVNKPIGVISSCKDPQGRPTILDLIPAHMYSGQRLYPIGRLDSNSRGALLLTTSGELTLQLTHPRYLHSKTYKVWVKGYLNSNVLRQWKEGIFIDGALTNKFDIKIKSTKRNSTLLELTLTEGRKRQIRRTAELLGHPVLDLQRVSIASINLGSLPEGYWRVLDFAEWSRLLPGR